MRFLLYNIRYATGTGLHFNLPLPYSGYLKNSNNNFGKIVQFIKSIKPDIIGLVEVDSGSFRSEKSNQAETIARELRHFNVYGSKYSNASVTRKVPILSKQGNAVLTNQKILSRKFHYFSKGVKRLVIELELEEISIFLVHLSIKFKHRHYQLMELHDMVKNAEKPVIAAGDFNVFQGDRELQLFLAATDLKNANATGNPTYPSRVPHRQLDYILYGPKINIVDFQIPDIKLSDHSPLICDFNIKK